MPPELNDEYIRFMDEIGVIEKILPELMSKIQPK